MLKNKKKILASILIMALFSVGCSESSTKELSEEGTNVTTTTENNEYSESLQTEKDEVEEKDEVLDKDTQLNNTNTTNSNTLGFAINEDNLIFNDKTYKIIKVDGGDRSGDRQSNVAVNIGFGDRVYWAITNEHGQLVNVFAENIVLQDDKTEPVNSSGRYYADEANVPGTEQSNLDQGHVIADSLGGVANAYNITPQDSTLNRHGEQAYMEKVIRDAGGCTNFKATIFYPNENTQIPSKYKYEYTLKGNTITDEFDNANPEKENNTNTKPNTNTNTESSKNVESGKLSDVDTNGNGKVTIAEAKAAGFKMPITKDHWLYQYMTDKDGDGLVGE